jgi:hypothetical protein
MAELLTSIQTGSGTPVFDPLSTPELQTRIDAFTSNSTEQTGSSDSILAFSNDVMIVKEDNSLKLAGGYVIATSYDYYQKGTYASVETKLQYNYNMTTDSVDAAFTNILSNITQELRPPKTSTTFTYDFKFSQNRNGTLSGSGGGGY